jgi:hypothetical protein
MGGGSPTNRKLRLLLILREAITFIFAYGQVRETCVTGGSDEAWFNEQDVLLDFMATFLFHFFSLSW